MLDVAMQLLGKELGHLKFYLSPADCKLSVAYHYLLVWAVHVSAAHVLKIKMSSYSCT